MAKRIKVASNRDVCIVGIARTPMGSLNGALASKTAVELGAIAIKAAVERSGIRAEDVDEVFMGHVLSANAGQAPARQAAIKAGLPDSVPCTAINKVCASGMKAVAFASQAIMLGFRDVVVAGGMESMTHAPHMSGSLRGGARFGEVSFVDAVQRDGLNDAFDNVPMGNFAELCAEKYNLSRADQDAYAAECYRKAVAATEAGKFKAEVVPVPVIRKRGEAPVLVEKDEEAFARPVSLASLEKLRPCFVPPTSVTAGNASPISDGASALVLMSREKAIALGVESKILAVIRGFDDAAHDPRFFTTAPSLAIPKALQRADVGLDEIDFFELNEAFSAVALANCQILGIDAGRVNIYGGAVALGHPLGCSGARIIATLCSVLHQENGRIGVAAVCNGGGGASAIVVERVVA
ncbi:acetyl-CoA C-acetyltransferase [Saprolegnia diclina VS20]|uniref:acetyl-CoA C-acetyltransferase n=1 Tax=Saprolegnia diclina (strain VS20) TaxID=1156394 RepID=T0R5E3_SAPDV|nr:acetyl-CoA C-acetyltransferase [Saprolegnia diclina VS20]EQC42161.1 acetyl-CoA C-acetyltransferase [Saprolegnia diclina VS20]|eukprot:XP_008604730.1 acetyl-CoA C-acetyltransferase [Saprolegnia diclina VS20]